MIKLYKGTVTAGLTDGTLLSSGTEATPLFVNLDSTSNEEKVVDVAIRADSGKKSYGDTTISFVGTTANKFCISTDGGSTYSSYGSGCVISSEITAVNTILKVKIKAIDTETAPSDDTSVDIRVQGSVVSA